MSKDSPASAPSQPPVGHAEPALMRDRVRDILTQESAQLWEQYGVVWLALFGSFAHGRPGEDSDIDLLVELERPLGLEFVALAEHLEARLGCRADLATFETLNQSRQHPRRRLMAEEIERTLEHIGTAPG